MIIECSQCQKQCYIDDAKVTPQGITICCTQCKMTFLVRSHPSSDSREQLPSTQKPSGASEQNSETVLTTPSNPLQEDLYRKYLPSLPTPNKLPIPEEAFIQEDDLPYPLAKASGADEALSIGCLPQAAIPVESLPQREPLKPNKELEARPLETSPLSGTAAESIPSATKRWRPARSTWINSTVVLVFLMISGLLAGGILARYQLSRGKDRFEETAERLVSKIAALFRFTRFEKGSIKISELNGYFVVRGKDNKIFVIEGTATNGYRGPCSFLQVNGILFDEKGALAASQVVYCGNILNLKELQTYSKQAILDKFANAYGSTLSNLNIEPNQSLPFMLVFFDPPANISEYSVEVFDFRTSSSKEP